MPRLPRALVLAVVCVASPAVAGVTVTEFTVPTANSWPEAVTAGPDGNVWFCELVGSKVGKITPAGAITEYALATGLAPRGIVAGPDGNLWFGQTTGEKIARITPNGVVTAFNLPGTPAGPVGVAPGPDGALWFAESTRNRIGRVTTAGAVTEPATLPNPSSAPTFIVRGPDDSLWFTEDGGARIGRLTTAGVLTEFAVTAGSRPYGIARGAEGALWFTEFNGNAVGRITVAGALTEFPLLGTQPWGIAAGPDGNLWVAEFGSNTVALVAVDGSVRTRIPVPGGPTGITTGPDGNVWVALIAGNKIARITNPCGDGALDAWEACDDGNTSDGDCCSSGCRIEAAGTACRPAAGPCDVAEACDGATAACPADDRQPATVECRAPSWACDAAEHCDGAGVDCPPDASGPDVDGDLLLDVCDVCVNPVPLRKLKLRLGGQKTPPGDDTLALSATLSVPTTPAVDPAADGLRLLLGDSASAALLDLPVAGGTGTGRWKANRKRTAWKYRGAGSGGGVVVAKLARKKKPAGTFLVTLRGKRGDWVLAPGPALATLALDTPLGKAGQCAATVAQCAASASGTTLRCRGEP